MENKNSVRWEKGKNNTLRFYKAKLPWKVKQFNREFALPEYFAPMIGNKKEIIIAELGAGMFCTIGSTWPGVKVRIYASDALADEFNQILKNANIFPLIPVTRENMENLPYKDNFFDIVHCCNALDHTKDPVKAIREMYRVVKPGGYIYLRHFTNVGEHENYQGLHMWNLDIGRGEAVIWNSAKKVLLSDLYKGFKSIKKRELDYEPNNMVVSILQKPL